MTSRTFPTLALIALIALAPLGLSASNPPASNPIDAEFDRQLALLDADRDGHLSRAEADDAPWFTPADQDGDGTLDPAELAALRAHLHRRAAAAPPASPIAAPSPSAPQHLKPAEHGIGRIVPDLALTSLDGQPLRIADLARDRPLVIAMTSATCPLSKRYFPSLAKLAADLAASGITLLLLNPFASETDTEIRDQLAQLDPPAPAILYARDPDLTLAAALQASSTTEVFLLDHTRTLLYRGALDDQYGIDYSLDHPRHHYLRDALRDHLADRRPRIAATTAPGCELDLPQPKLATSHAPDITYHRDIARIFQAHCVECHRDGGIAPFALDSPDLVLDRARVIRRVVDDATMPPWFAATPAHGHASPWANDRSLPDRDKADLLSWLNSPDRPLGDPADAPAPRSFPGGWSIGQPDHIVELSRPYQIKAGGIMPYQHDTVQTSFPEDRWVTAYEILPTAPQVVHHVIVEVHQKGQRPRPGDGFFAAYVPGNGTQTYPAGFARRLPAGAQITFQIHYTPTGVAAEDRLRLGLVFSDSPPAYEVQTHSLSNRKLSIPPGAPDHIETASRRLPIDLPVTSFMAHMHVRGKAFRFELAHPDGTTETLLDIPRYDFNWQLRYDLASPRILPRGSTVKIVATFDNSPANPANPDPTRRVPWGDQTSDEMMIGYVESYTPIHPSTP
jgi:mono/diheme cytochrome c family protein